MNFFNRLFGNRPSELAPKLPTCNIYYSASKGIFIAAVHRDTQGWTPLGNPMSLLPFHSPAEAIGGAVLSALRGSRGGLSEQEVESETKAAFRCMGERGWGGVHKRWEFIQVIIEPGADLVTISPMCRIKSGGYEERNELAYRGPLDEKEIGRVVWGLVHGPAPAVQPAWNHDENADKDLPNLGDPAPLSVSDFCVGDRIVDPWGNRGTVLQVDPTAQHGLGILKIHYDDERERNFALVGSGLARIPQA